MIYFPQILYCDELEKYHWASMKVSHIAPNRRKESKYMDTKKEMSLLQAIIQRKRAKKDLK